jgi:hypothetical protein
MRWPHEAPTRECHSRHSQTYTASGHVQTCTLALLVLGAAVLGFAIRRPYGFRPRFFLRVGCVDLRKDAAAALYIYVRPPVPGRVWLDAGSLQSHQPLKCLLPLPHRFQLPSAQRKGPLRVNYVCG